jgi:hypothetical protein
MLKVIQKYNTNSFLLLNNIYRLCFLTEPLIIHQSKNKIKSSYLIILRGFEGMEIERYLKYIQKSESIFPMDNLHKDSEPLSKTPKDERRKLVKQKKKIE